MGRMPQPQRLSFCAHSIADIAGYHKFMKCTKLRARQWYMNVRLCTTRLEGTPTRYSKHNGSTLSVFEYFEWVSIGVAWQAKVPTGIRLLVTLERQLERRRRPTQGQKQRRSMAQKSSVFYRILIFRLVLTLWAIEDREETRPPFEYWLAARAYAISFQLPGLPNTS